MRIDKIVSGAKYRMGEPFQKLPIFGILVGFEIKRILKIC